jgi:hypothetical protein
MTEPPVDNPAAPRRRLPYNPQNPPQEPPAGADPLTWMLAYALHVEHQPGVDGFCTAGSCRRPSNLWPCEALKLARCGFLDAAWPVVIGSNQGRHW